MTKLARTGLTLGLLAMAVASPWPGGRVAAQGNYLPADIGDLSAAKRIEIKDGSGRAVLCGEFVRQPTIGDEIERESELSGCGGASKASGEAEVESQTEGGRLEQEVELSVLNLAPGATYSIHIDSKLVGRFTTNATGAADVEFTTEPVKQP
jgi:hypothetical protein